MQVPGVLGLARCLRAPPRRRCCSVHPVVRVLPLSNVVLPRVDWPRAPGGRGSRCCASRRIQLATLYVVPGAFSPHALGEGSCVRAGQSLEVLRSRGAPIVDVGVVPLCCVRQEQAIGPRRRAVRGERGPRAHRARGTSPSLARSSRCAGGRGPRRGRPPSPPRRRRAGRCAR